ncbi:MAG: flavodoxin family protein [Lachnospiraceae bacterium]|nr:flavodoxin family protein [Lachnospiraceae bacterium]
MRVIIINGSNRKNGITAAALHMIEAGLNEKGVETTFYNLGEINMSHCMGCCTCYKTGHCCIKDDAERISEMIAEADGLIMGTPTYASNVSGLMKDLIDRGHFVIEQLLHNKACVTIATGENYGSRDALKVLNNLVIYSGGMLCDSFAMNAPFNGTEDVREKLSERCSKATQRLMEGIQDKAGHPIQKLIHLIVLNVGIRPLVRKKRALYQGVADKWGKMGIQL